MITFCLLLCFCSCVHESPAAITGGRSGTREVSVHLCADALPAYGTRSGVSVSDSGLGAVDIYFYERGSLCSSLTVNADANQAAYYYATVQLQIGSTYEILVLANHTVHSPPATLDAALSSLSYVSDGITAWNSSGIPMSGRATVTVSSSTSELEIRLTRLLARLSLTIDCSSLRHGNIVFTSARVRQMNRVCPFFRDARATSSGGVCDGDLASAADLSALNSYGNRYSTTFYLAENLQGDILYGNDDPDRKIPSLVEAAGCDPGLCTYLEILGTYSGSSGKLTGEPLTARLFLGGDATGNFDIERNCTYDVTLVITDSGCLRSDWKIDGNLQDSRVLNFPEPGGQLEPGGSLTATLNTNLSYASGDYSYAITGDTGCFNVTADASGRAFTVTGGSGAPSGAAIQIHVSSWDGKLSSSYSATVHRTSSPDYEIEWGDGGGVFYVAQRRGLRIIDRKTGSAVSGTVRISSTSGFATPWRSGTSWYVDAVGEGDDLLTVSVNGEAVMEVPVSVLAPELRFPSAEILLPLDGAPVVCGPYYYRTDGSRLAYDDFAPDLYEEHLFISISRSLTAAMKGKSWRTGVSGGNPAVSCMSLEDDYGLYCLALEILSSGGCAIEDNYDFSQSRVYLERITAYPADTGCGVAPVSAMLYTEDPFTGSVYLGARSSWALARWPVNSKHDEEFSFSTDNLLKPGNDYAYAGAEYVFSAENKYSFVFPDGNTVRMTVLYGSYDASAMPERYFYFAPVMRNRNSEELFRSDYRYSADFTVNLSLAGVARDNGAGGCDVQVEWSFPRTDEGLLSYLEDNVVACTESGMLSAKGMYRRMYVVYGFSPEELMSAFVPGYCFRDLDGGGHLAGGFYHVPEEYAAGYDLVLWKLSELYPDTSGWLEK